MTKRFLGVLVVALCLSLGWSHAPAESSTKIATANSAQFYAGTIRWMDGSIGTTFAFHEVDGDPSGLANLGLISSGSVKITGPAGWNNNAPLVSQCSQDKNDAKTLCDQWENIAPLPGVYTATNASGLQWTATIDTSVATPFSITSARPVANGVHIAWSPQAVAGSYWLQLERVNGNSYTYLDSADLPASGGTAAFYQGQMTTGTYRVIVVSRPFDISQDTVPPARLTYAHATLEFSYKATPPLSFMNPTLHGSASTAGGKVILSSVSIAGIPSGSTVSLQCVKGCSAHSMGSGGPSYVFQSLKNLKVADRAVAIIRVSRPGYAGFYDRVMFHVTSSKFAFETRSCMAPGKSKSVLCSSLKK